MAESIPLTYSGEEEDANLLEANFGEGRKIYNQVTPTSYLPCFGSRRLSRWKYSGCARTPGSCHRRRRSRNRWIRALLWITFLCTFFIIISLTHGILHPSYMFPPEHYNKLEWQARDHLSGVGPGNPQHEKIFIAANIINEDLIRGSWGNNLMELVRLLGPQDVFVSIYENDAGKGTAAALEELGRKLACNNSIVSGDRISLSEFPAVTLPSGERRVKRLNYLAEVRNRATLPLQSGHIVEQWEATHPTFRRAEARFDKVLFLNEVYFNPIEALQLLFSTNRGQYSAACAIDFVAKFMFYDTFVVRDMEGYGMGFRFYPWFPAIGEQQSRNDVLALKDTVRVRSCWGGMAAFNADIFRPEVSENNETVPALRFRSIDEAYWEEAECCLLFADMEVRRAMLHEQGKGVFVNPYIRVAYDQATWDWLPFFRRYERVFQFLQYIVSKIGYPEYNPRREHGAGARVEERVWIPDGESGTGHWEDIERNADAGGWCGQRRMFVMKNDLAKVKGDEWGKNWEKIKIPWGL